MPTSTSSPSTLFLQRMVTISLLFITLAGLLSLGPLLLMATLLGDLAGGRSLAWSRGLVFLTWVVVGECVGVVLASLLWVRWWMSRQSEQDFLLANFRLQTAWTSAMLGAARVIYQMKLTIEGQEVLRPGPYLVFIRHASIADTMLPGVAISRITGIRLRYVLKRELLWDPCLNIVGCRLPNHFVDRDSTEGEKEVAAIASLAAGLSSDEGVLIYPEGTRFTPAKFTRAMEKLAQSHPELMSRASRLKQVLPPRLGGPGALLQVKPPLDVIFCAHVGFEGATTLADVVSGSMIGRHIQVKFWRVRAAEIPTDPADRVAWLYDEWAKVDQQVCRWLEEVPPRPVP